MVKAIAKETVYDLGDSVLFKEGDEVDILGKVVAPFGYGRVYPAVVYVHKRTLELNTAHIQFFDVDLNELKDLPTLGDGDWFSVIKTLGDGDWFSVIK